MAESESKRDVKGIENRKAKDSKRELVLCDIAREKNEPQTTCLPYRYMYLKTYAKFTFCIKSPGHVSDENFLCCCMHLTSKISSHGV